VNRAIEMAFHVTAGLMPVSLVERLEFPDFRKPPAHPPTAHEVPAPTVGIVPRQGLVLIAARPFEVSPWIQHNAVTDHHKTMS